MESSTPDPREIAASLNPKDADAIRTMVHAREGVILDAHRGDRLERLGLVIVPRAGFRRRRCAAKFTDLGRAVAAILAEGTVGRG